MKTECSHCGKTFSVPASWINTTVRCPQCNGDVFVGNDPRPSKAAAAIESDEDDEFRLAPEVERPKVELFTDEVSSPPPKASAESKATPSEPDARICPNCDAILPPDGMLCVECGYHLVMKRVLQTEFQEVEYNDSIGFARWLDRQLAEGESLDSLVWAFHAVLVVVGVILASIYHPQGWTVLLVLGVIYTIWYQWMRRRDGFRPWGAWLWDLHFKMRRRFGWRAWTPPFQPLRQFSAHGADFGDEQLEALTDVERLEVLDLEGTSVTARGCTTRLAGCDSLRYVILRRTRVGPEGAKRLQVMLPEVNLWL